MAEKSKLTPNPEFSKVASDEAIGRAKSALEANGISAVVVNSGAEAKAKVLSMLQAGEEVFTATSMTNDAIGLNKEINDSGKYKAVRPQLMKMDGKTEAAEMRSLGARPGHVVGSVHAVTEDGHVLIASAGGSQIAPYVYGAGKVIWVVGAQKVVKDTTQALRRIEQYAYPMEDQRALDAYGVNSSIGKVLIVNREQQPGRVTVVLVKEKLGF